MVVDEVTVTGIVIEVTVPRPLVEVTSTVRVSPFATVIGCGNVADPMVVPLHGIVSV
jgi:hypothetical protein